MSAVPHLHHVTLGGTRVRSPRAAAKGLSLVRPLVDELELMSGAPIMPRTRDLPARSGYMVRCLRPYGPSAPLFHVYGPAPEGADLPCIVSFGVGVEDGLEASALWHSLHSLEADVKTNPDEPPAELRRDLHSLACEPAPDGPGGVVMSIDRPLPPTDPENPPKEWPWCAAVAHPGLLAIETDAALWLADLERCMAWTLWECHHGRTHRSRA